MSERSCSTLRYAVTAAKAAGVPVPFDLNYRGSLWSQEPAGTLYREIIPLADIVFAGDDEASIAVGDTPSPEEFAHRISGLGPGQAVIKLGAKGAVASVDGELFHQAALPVNAGDAVGAGDAFVAGYLSQLMSGLGPADRLRVAALAGAFACLVHGDWEGAPRRSDLTLLQTREPVSR